jgi:hypothetical protein
MTQPGRFAGPLASATSDTRTVMDRGPSTRLEARHTLEQMRAHVHTELAVPIVWETARQIIEQVTPRDEVAQAQAIRQWCAGKWRFVNDPMWHQLLTTPLYCLEHIRDKGFVQGNCADAAMMAAALCLAIHLSCKFAAVSFGKQRPPYHAPYSHVMTICYPMTRIGSTAVVEMDFTRPTDLARAAFTRRLLVTV